MGAILKTKNLTTGAELAIVVLLLSVICGGVYYLAPGLHVTESKQLQSMEIDKGNIDNVTKTSLVQIPSTIPSTDAAKNPLVRIAGYAWNAEMGIIIANGGPRTTKNSLMEKNGVNLEIIRQDACGGLRDMQIKFIEQFNGGEEYPSSDKAAVGVIIMGDGAAFYVSTTQASLDAKFGKGKYHLQVVGCMGLSYGEDKVIGPPQWKTNPQSMRGALISTVGGDGDWVVALNYIFSNKGLKVNPDFSTYDSTAVNFYPATNDDYVESGKALIASQTKGFTVPLKEVSNGKLTGKTINKKIDGTSTWTPADKNVFDACTGLTDIASTKDFNNQMAATLIVVKEWAATHEKVITNILKSAFTAGNQLKQSDEWMKAGAKAVGVTYQLNMENDGKYWYDMFKGQSGSKNGISFNMGGSKVFNYADAMQYYGITDGKNRYKSVYEQVSSYLTELNPGGFNESVKGVGVVPYDEAVNLYFMKNINDIDAGQVEKADYSKTKTEVFANGNWQINFASGKSDIQPSSTKDLSSIYNLLVESENYKIQVVGHTDNTGNSAQNVTLSKDRAQAVVDYLLAKGLSVDRVQDIQGKGDSEPVADNGTSLGKAKNRRVQITILK